MPTLVDALWRGHGQCWKRICLHTCFRRTPATTSHESGRLAVWIGHCVAETAISYKVLHMLYTTIVHPNRNVSLDANLLFVH